MTEKTIIGTDIKVMVIENGDLFFDFEEKKWYKVPLSWVNQLVDRYSWLYQIKDKNEPI